MVPSIFRGSSHSVSASHNLLPTNSTRLPESGAPDNPKFTTTKRVPRTAAYLEVHKLPPHRCNHSHHSPRENEIEGDDHTYDARERDGRRTLSCSRRLTWRFLALFFAVWDFVLLLPTPYIPYLPPSSSSIHCTFLSSTESPVDSSVP